MSTRTLRISFETQDALRREYAGNISNGGIFVETNVDFEVRETVVVEIRLAYCAQTLELEGEVVHVVAPTPGAVAQPGVAVHFAEKASVLRDLFSPLIGTAEATEDEEGTGNGVRRSPRIGAVLNAHLATSDGREVHGETRNVSRGGALLQVEDALVAVGEKVDLSMTRPDDGSQVRVGARVVREEREQDTGSIGLGLEFEAETDALSEVGEFVDIVRADEHKRRLGGISGSIAELGIEHLLQMFCSSAKGTLTVFRGDQDGFVIFEGGLVRAVRLGEAKGNKALARILEWREGRFEFHATADLEGIDDEALSLDAALLNAMRLQDETQREEIVALPPEAHLRVVQAAVDAAGDLTKGEEAILELAQVGMDVGRIFDIVPEPDAEIALLMHGLVERGLITVAS